MDIFSCESEMIAANYSDEKTHTDDPESYHFNFGLHVGPSDPNNNGPELAFPDTNIYFLMFPSLLRCLVSEGFNKL